MAPAPVETDPGQRVGADVAFTCVRSEKQAQAVVDDRMPEAGLMEGGMQPPDAETLKALLSSLSLQRIGHPDEIAAAIAFLASPAASYVMGGGAATKPQTLR